MSHTEREILAEIKAKMPIAEIQEKVNEIAVDAAEYARSIAPVYAGPERADRIPGHYRDSIHAEEKELKTMPAAMVVTRASYANIIEFGSKNTPEFGVFAKTADHYGGTVSHVSGKSSGHGSGRRLD